MLGVDDYANNSEDAEAASYLYDTYIGVELKSPDDNGNAIYGHVNKRVWDDDGQAVGVVNHNPLIDTSKY